MEIILLNNFRVNELSVLSNEQIPMEIDKSGNVFWNPSGVFETFCECDVTYFPFDTQTCQVILTTWGYTSFQINLFPADEAIKTKFYTDNGQWTLQGTTSSFLESLRDDASIHEVVFSLSFRRRPWFEMINNIVPVILLALLGTMIFRVPPRSGEKIGYTLTIILSYTVYLTMVSTTFPSSSHTISILCKYSYIYIYINSTNRTATR